MTAFGEGLENPRPPVFLGCFALIAVAVLVLGVGACTLVFLDSGADTGRLTLEDAAVYAPGTATFVGERNFYVAGLMDGSVAALSDLDAANRRDQLSRCRVAPIDAADPALAALLERFGSRRSPAAGNSGIIFRETCNNALYDLAGIRLDRDGPNLDRYATSIRGDGRLVVDVSKRTCSERREGQLSLSRAC